MAIDPAFLQQIKKAKDDFKSQQRRFYDTPFNCDQIEKWLKTNSPDLTTWTSPYIFHAAFSFCESTNDPEYKLEQRPAPEPEETPQERHARLEAKERLAGPGSIYANSGDHVETERQSAARILRDMVSEKEARDKLLTDQSQQRILDQAAREKKLADFGDVLRLTTGDIDFTGATDLTPRQLILLTEQYSTKHLKVYNQRREKWLRENKAEPADWRHASNA